MSLFTLVWSVLLSFFARVCVCVRASVCVCDSARVCVCICISDALALFSPLSLPLFSSLFRCVSVYARPFSVTAKCTMINNDQDGGEDVAVVRALSLPLTLPLPLALPSVSRTTGSGRAQGRPGQCRHTFTHTHRLPRRRRHNVRVVGRSALRGTSFLAATAEAEAA